MGNMFERSTANYGFVVKALNGIAALDPTLRGRRALARFAARRLLPVELESLTYAFAELLGEPAESARRLLHDWFFYRQMEAASWNGSSSGRATFPDAGRIGAYAGACSRGIVVATIHLGDYLEGLRQLRLATRWSRRVFVIRRALWSELEEHAFGRVASAELDITVLRGGRAATTAVRELRRGNVVVALFDLPGRFGRTIDVELLGRRVRVVRGPAELAVLGDADVLPIVTRYDARGVSVVEAAPVIATQSVRTRCEGSQAHERGRLPRDPRPSRNAREQRVRDITQRLWRLAETYIRACPAQWSNWPMVAELCAPPAGVDASR
jgi:hypothetical protein